MAQKIIIIIAIIIFVVFSLGVGAGIIHGARPVRSFGRQSMDSERTEETLTDDNYNITIKRGQNERQ